jgi:hypothetical protein
MIDPLKLLKLETMATNPHQQNAFNYQQPAFVDEEASTRLIRRPPRPLYGNMYVYDPLFWTRR